MYSQKVRPDKGYSLTSYTTLHQFIMVVLCWTTAANLELIWSKSAANLESIWSQSGANLEPTIE